MRVAWFRHGPWCGLPEGLIKHIFSCQYHTRIIADVDVFTKNHEKSEVDVIMAATRLGKTTSLCRVSATQLSLLCRS